VSAETIVTPDEVNALIAHGLPEEDLLVLIAREESRLASRLGTPLTGSIELTLRPRRTTDPILLPRMPLAGSVDVTDDAGAVDVDTAGAVVTRRSGFWATPTTVAFEIDDLAEVKSAIIDLIRLALTASPYLQESAEGHSSTRSGTVERNRAQIIAQLNPHRRRSVSVPM
jgi:hypothetical protein